MTRLGLRLPMPYRPLRLRPVLRACGALALLLVALGLADCGKKGSPQPPAGVPNVYPRSYPRE